MRSLAFTILTALLLVIALFLILVYNQIGECKKSTITSAIIATILSIIPPMFYRSGVGRKFVMVVHIVLVTIASHFLSVVWAEIHYGICKTEGEKDMALVYASVIIIAYAMSTVAGHFMKRKRMLEVDGEEMQRMDLS